MKVFSSLLTIALFVSMVGCSSTKKKVQVDNADAEVSVGSEGASGLEVNGDSDSGRAGALKTVYFDYDSSTLSSSTKSTLTANAEFLKSNATVEVQVEGHADERGGVQYNLALGESRAKTIKDFLVALGVSAKRITTISFGKERPISFGHDESSWSQNRRGNFVVTAK